MNQDTLSKISEIVDDQIVSDISVAISKAYQANHRTFLEDNTLSCNTAKDFKPHMLRTRVDYFLQQTKNPKIQTSVKFNKNNSCRFIEILICNKIILTQNTVKAPDQAPRPAKFRGKLQSELGQYYFEFLSDMVEIKELGGRIYLQLVHGGNGAQPSFIKMGTELKSDKWLCFLDIPIISLDQKDIEEIDDARHPARKQSEKTGVYNDED